MKTIKYDFSKFKLKTIFNMDSKTMSILGIEKMEVDESLNPNHYEELWTFCKLTGKNKKYNKKRKYLISTYGRVFNLYSGILVSLCNSSCRSVNSSGEHYKYVNLSFGDDEYIKIDVHRLVALAFLEKRKDKPVVDHIDEHPSHNFIWNLQWVDKSTNSNKHNMYVERERTGRAVDTTWKYEELVAICKMMAEGHKATYIYNEMLKLTNNNPKIQYERIRTLYKHIMKRGDFHDIAVKCGVKFESNYLKEKGSVSKVESEK